MKVNLARWDRSLRLFFGFFMTLWAAAGGPWWCWIGIYLITTSTWGLCPVYSIFNLRTARENKRSLTPGA